MNKNAKLKPIMSTALPLGWLVVGLIIIACIGIWQNNELSRTPAPPPTTKPSDWRKITDTRALFSTAVLLERNKTFILMPIRFEKGVEPIWLNYDSTSSAQPNELLITHPALTDINWNRIDEGVIHLYQKNKTYKSIDDLVKNPPEKSKLVIDNGLNLIDIYKNIAHTELTNQLNLTQVDYILTTYIPIKEKNDAFYYENIIDASSAIINKNNAMSWMVFAPNASATNPFYIGDIHIDYRR